MKTDNTTLKKLTRGEEEVMQILWQLGAGSINDLIAAMQEPKPKYTTIATFVKILENKGYVGRTERGKSYEYYPLVPKEEYAKTVVSSILNSYFDGSLAQMVSFFSRREDLSIQETEQILAIIRQARAIAQGTSQHGSASRGRSSRRLSFPCSEFRSGRAR